jgi:hypothetical protein
MKLNPDQTFGILLALFVAAWVNAIPYGPTALTGLRFTLPILNYLFFVFVQFIPFRLFEIAASWSGVRRVGAFIVVIPLMLIAVPSACGASGCVVLGKGMLRSDPSFDKVRDMPATRGHVVVYRTNGGAMTDFGIVVRQECSIVPWLVVVEHPLVAQYHAYDAGISVASPSSVLIEIQGDLPTRIEAKLRYWPCIVVNGLGHE